MLPNALSQGCDLTAKLEGMGGLGPLDLGFLPCRSRTQRDRHLQSIAEHGRTGWQKRSGYTRRVLVEAAISRLKRGIGDALRSRADPRRTTEVAIAISALNRMLELGARSASASPKLRQDATECVLRPIHATQPQNVIQAIVASAYARQRAAQGWHSGGCATDYRAAEAPSHRHRAQL
jgi:hypothetical protein